MSDVPVDAPVDEPDVPQPQEEQPPAPPEPAKFTDLVEAVEASPVDNNDITEVRVVLDVGNLGTGYFTIGSCVVDENGVMNLVAIVPSADSLG